MAEDPRWWDHELLWKSINGGLRNGLNALYGHDLAVARRELEWVEINLAKAPDLSPVAEALKEMVARLECS